MTTISDTLHIQVEHFTGQEEGDRDVGYPYYVASCEQIGLVTDGESLEELMVNIREALAASLEETDTVALFNVIPNPRVMLQQTRAT